MAKQLLFDDQARLKLLSGVETLAKAVATTMGPTGRNVIIDKSFAKQACPFRWRSGREASSSAGRSCSRMT